MFAKKHLYQYYLQEIEVLRLKDQLVTDSVKTEKCTASYGGVKVQTSCQGGLDAAVILVQQTREKLKEAEEKLLDIRRDIENLIAQVSNEKSRIILEYRYLCCEQSMKRIAANMDISRSYAYALEAAGLREVEQILKRRSNYAV